MSLAPFIALFKRGQLGAALAAHALHRPFYKLSYLAALKSTGMMDRLCAGPLSFEVLAAAYAPGARAGEALQAWLQMGCKLRLLRLGRQGYALNGLAKTLALPRNDATLALTQEVASLHYRLITDTPTKLRAGELWRLEDQDGALTARSSRALEVFQLRALERFVPQSGACHLLEVGCGSAIYIRHAALRNPRLTAVGLELQDNVARLAQQNVHRWGLQQRVRIELGDIRHYPGEAGFDLVTLYNNIYYCAIEERVALLAKTRSLLRPHGALLLVTCCQGGNPGIEALNLWGASNEHGGRLPYAPELVEQLTQAGYARVETMRLIPGDSFYAFHARR